MAKYDKRKTKEVIPPVVPSPEMNALNAVIPNSRYEDYTDKTVVLSQRSLARDYQAGDRRFHVLSGFGCSPDALGRAIFGYYMVDGEHNREERYNVEGIAVNQATPEELVKFAQMYKDKWK